MRRRKRRSALALPRIMAEMSLASFEVIGRRTLMMATRTCSDAEYKRMVREKMVAAASSIRRLAMSGGRAPAASLLKPWHSRAKANVKRLRRT
jgi:hypothetical protein